MRVKAARGNVHSTDWAWQPPGAEEPASPVKPADPVALHPPPGDLSGWAKIAAEARLSPQDVRHLAAISADHRLPVTIDRGVPYAYREEIAAWRRHHNHGRPFLAKLRGKATSHNADALFGSGVYAVTWDGCGRIKIGFTTALSSRIDTLETASPFPLVALAFIVGDRALEQELHKRLADYRAHREWFLDDPEVRTTLICAGRKHGGVWAL